MIMPTTKEIVQTTLTVAETDNTITIGAQQWDQNFRDRLNYDRQSVLTQAITAWRSNPIARRIIELTTEFTVGTGFTFEAPPSLQKYLTEFWHHPLNNLDQQLPEWADEAWRTGDLFLLCSKDAGGQLYVRALPSEYIGVIETRENDYRQEISYKHDALDENPYPAYAVTDDQQAFVLHFPLNRAVGASFGESDLAPVLYWISLYRQWLEDRARLNYFRQLFSFVLTRPFTSQAEKDKYMHDFAFKMPKKSGGVLGLDTTETLEALRPELSSSDAAEDGIAIKKMIATGVGIPMHYFAEPESSTRTTAEAAGTPTFKRYERRQEYLKEVVRTLLLTAVEVRRQSRMDTVKRVQIKVLTPDVTEKDNATLAIAVQRITSAFAPIYNAKLITPKEFIRLVYRFVGEDAPAVIGAFSPVDLRGGTGKSAPGASPLPTTAPGDPTSQDTGAAAQPA
jgi:hypothetical protein